MRKLVEGTDNSVLNTSNVLIELLEKFKPHLQKNPELRPEIWNNILQEYNNVVGPGVDDTAILR